MIRILSILGLMLSVFNFAQAQTPSDSPVNAPIVQASNTPGSAIGNTISSCCSSYNNFLGTNPTCGVAQTNRDAWFQINGMTAGQQYNFMYIETGNRQTWVEIFELPAGKDKALPASYKTVKCARANNVAFYPGSSVSATFIPPNASSAYYVRFQRLNVGDEAIEGNFQVTKSYPNEEPCGATLLQVQPAQGTSPTFGNNVTAADWKPDILTGPLCGPNNDVWYKFVATACSMQIFVDNLSQNVYEMQAAILASTDGDCNNLMEVTPCGGQPDQYLDIMLTADNLTIGKTYYVIVDGYSPPYVNAVGNFSIEVFKKPNGPACPNIGSPCDCADPATCGGSGALFPNSIAGNAALNAAILNPAGNGCYNFAANGPAPPLCGGNNTVEFCIKYTATSSDTLIAFDNVVSKDAACEVLVTKNIAYEEGSCTLPINPICLDYNKKTPVFRVTPGKTFRFCRQITTNGADIDCLGKTYQSFCAFLWKIPTNYNVTKTVCNGESVKVGNNTYSATGVYTNVLTAGTGCDSIVTLNLTVLPAIKNTITTSICNGDSYTIGSVPYNSSGTFTATVKSKNGCDSTVTLILTVLPAKIATLNKTICFGEKITIGTTTYDKTGVYTASVKTNGLSCDSTVNLTLTVLPKIGSTFKKVVCNGETFVSNGKPYDKSGNYDEVYKAKNGCDSIYTLALTVLPVLKETVNASICDGKSYVIAGKTFNTPGNYTIVTKKPVLGCDSTITLNLKISNKVETLIKETICSGDSKKIGNNTYNTTGVYVNVFNNSNSCDSIVTLDLTVTPVLTSNITETVCFGKTITIGGKIYSTTTKEKITIKNSKKCDSLVINLDLTFLPENKTVLSGSICSKGGSVTIKGKTYTAKGEYQLGTGIDKNGCKVDTIAVITEENIAVAGKEIDPAACGGKAGGNYEITAPLGPDYTYTWSSPNGNGTKLTDVKAGNYTVTVTSSKSPCSEVFPVVISERKISIVKSVSGASCNSASNGSITILSPVGGNTTYSWSNGATTATVSNLKPGDYSVTAKDNDGCVATEKITVQQGTGITANIAETAVTIYLGESATFTLSTAVSNPKVEWSPVGPSLTAGTTYTYTVVPKAVSKKDNNKYIPDTYTVTVTDANGCTATDQVSVITKFDIPSVFTPDAEGNNVFTPIKTTGVNSNLVYTKFLVFNRWGEIVYDNANEHTWKGTFKGKNCPTDVYIYRIETTVGETKIDPIVGEVTLLR
jgi:gliding motility-associated-like protein